MKKHLLLSVGLFAVSLILFSQKSIGQGFENFDNANLTASYTNGSFEGNNNITWTYVHARDEGDFPIDGKGIMLRRADEPSSLSATITGGIGNFVVDTRKAFTGNTQRKLELVINGAVIQQFEPAFGEGADDTVIPFVVDDIDIPGTFDLILRLYGADGNQQIVLDNISWTAFDGEVTQVSKPIFSPNGGSFYSPVEVNITTTTPDATVYYSTTGDQDSWIEFTQPVVLTETTTLYAYATADNLDDSDVAEATFTFLEVIEVATLAELREKPADETVYIYTGNAVIVAMDGFRNRKFIQDETAAILIDDSPGIISTSYELYDVITNVVGTIDIFRDMVRFQPEQNTAPSTENTPVAPVTMTIPDITQNDQARLIILNNAVFTGIEPGAVFVNGSNYTITDGTNEFVVRTDFFNVDYIGEPVPVQPINITGVVLTYFETLQIVPRFAADIEIYTSVQPVLQPFLNIYPNPAANQFTIAADNNIHTLAIFDITGKKVYSIATTGNKVKIQTQLPTGIYVVQIQTDKGVEMRKLQITK